MDRQSSLTQSIQYTKGIGPKRAEFFRKVGVETVFDLLYYFPRSYQDRSTFVALKDVVAGDCVTIKATVLTKGVRRTRSMKIFELIVDDGTSRLRCLFFNQPFLDTTFKVDDEVILSGKIDLYRNTFQMNSPDFELLRPEDTEGNVHAGCIVPIYPLTEGLSQRLVRKTMRHVIDHFLPEVAENLPNTLIEKYTLLPRGDALGNIHFPRDQQTREKAYFRLVFEEFYLFESAIAHKMKGRKEKPCYFRMRSDPDLEKEFQAALSFSLTRSQLKVCREITDDFNRPYSMNRVLQGDVGSGKTMVAAYAVFYAVRHGFQACMLVPTEILAEQHFKTLEPLFNKHHICLALVSGSSSKKEKKDIAAALKKGSIDCVIGTHALLQETISFAKLGLVVIDEQHKFGVAQRAYLKVQEHTPHILVMSATPIPRTLGLVLFADLDVSTLTELPFGMRDVKTYWITQKKESDVYAFVQQRLRAKEQAYIVFPLVEESMKVDLSAATEKYELLKKTVFKDFKVALVHGRIDKNEKNDIMQRFRSGEIDLLVATTVIEVGIDNPNASIIIIQHADRFGLSQLHQMRGRVGRGKKESYCFLFGDPTTETGKRRLRLMTKTNDGFKIAEEDLLLRGPGEFLGTRQSGLPEFKLADIVSDAEILSLAKQEAFQNAGLV
jgi:ATP-dependent DNA helicase RecG